jgi:hypothetical protein
MTSKEDYNRLLLFLYKELITEKKDGVGPKSVVREFENWGPDRINAAYAYLRDNHYLKFISLPSNYNGVFDFWIQGLYPYAIMLVEEELENKKQEKLREIFNENPWENIKLIKKEENKAIFIDASIGHGLIIIGDTNLQVKAGDIIERSLNNGSRDKFIVVEKGLIYEHAGVPTHYEAKVRKE